MNNNLATSMINLVTEEFDVGKSFKGKILLIDDDPSILKIFGVRLRDDGYKVYELSDGKYVAEILRTKKIDVVMTDVNLPGMSGIDILRVIREFDAELPVILMTANVFLDTAIEAVELGAIRYLSKPFNFSMISKTIEDAIQVRQNSKLKVRALKLYDLVVEEKNKEIRLIADFEDALDRMYMVYQPIVSGSTGKTVAYEALLRTENGEFTNPMHFVRTAEQLDRLDDLGQQIRKAIVQSIDSAPKDTSIFVNLHPKELLIPALYDTKSAFAKFAHRIVFEITEVESVESLLDLDSHLKKLRLIGYRLAIDDLGSGYSALNSFPLLRPEFVKFDKSFLAKINDDIGKQKLISLITSYCKDIGVTPVAEGVETVEMRDTAMKLGCDLIQGYFYALPSKNFQILKSQIKN